MRVHKVSVHEDTKSFLCSTCGSAFKANSALIDHRKRVHLQIKPHQCEHCKKDFFSKKDYAEHVRTHTGEKPFQCTVSYSFKQVFCYLPETVRIVLYKFFQYEDIFKKEKWGEYWAKLPSESNESDQICLVSIGRDKCAVESCIHLRNK